MDEVPLTGWKDIATFLGSSVRTVQRFERELGLPVHRTQPNKGAVVRAYPSELRRWLESRHEVPAEPGQMHGSPGQGHPPASSAVLPINRRRRAQWLLAAIALSVTALVVAGYLASSKGPTSTDTPLTTAHSRRGPVGVVPETASDGQKRVKLVIRPTVGRPMELEVMDGSRGNLDVGPNVALILQPAVRGSNLLLDVRRRVDGRPSDRSLATIRLTAGRPAHVDIDGIGMEIEWSRY
jgi:hypothetical protein